MTALELVITGTDTGVGKTHVTRLLTAGLRALGRRVWLHKPVACGGWADGLAEDARRLTDLVADGQDPASLCRHQWPLACSPHLAAAAAGDRVELATLVAEAAALRGDHDLVIEGAGGLLSPLSCERGTTLELALALDLPLVVVTRPHLGTLNHSALTVAAIRAAGARCLGLVLNHHERLDRSDPAIANARDELSALCDLPILTELAHGDEGASSASSLAVALRDQHHAAPR